MTEALVDANFLIALAYPKDNNHARATQFAASTALTLLVPAIVLPEVMYNLRRVGGTQAALRFGETLVAQATPLLPLMAVDFERAVAVMRTYQDAELDLWIAVSRPWRNAYTLRASAPLTGVISRSSARSMPPILNCFPDVAARWDDRSRSGTVRHTGMQAGDSGNGLVQPRRF